VAGLGHPVEIVRDEWGYPHIYAKTTDDVLFAQGFVHAQDRSVRLIQLLLFLFIINQNVALILSLSFVCTACSS
jgi:hypothetical protein